MTQLTNRDSMDIIRRLLKAAVTDREVFESVCHEMIQRCDRDTDNWLVIIEGLGGVLTGVLMAIAEKEEMQFEQVVNDIFNDDYAAIMDMDDEIQRENNRGTASTGTGEGTNLVDRALGSGEVDGLGEDQ